MTYPGLPPAPWSYHQVEGAYVVTDALGEDVLEISFNGSQARATSIADFVCDAREVA